MNIAEFKSKIKTSRYQQNCENSILPTNLLQINLKKLSLYDIWAQYFFKPSYVVEKSCQKQPQLLSPRSKSKSKPKSSMRKRPGSSLKPNL